MKRTSLVLMAFALGSWSGQAIATFAGFGTGVGWGFSVGITLSFILSLLVDEKREKM